MSGFSVFDHKTSTQSTKQLVSNITIAGFQHQIIFYDIVIALNTKTSLSNGKKKSDKTSLIRVQITIFKLARSLEIIRQELEMPVHAAKKLAHLNLTVSEI